MGNVVSACFSPPHIHPQYVHHHQSSEYTYPCFFCTAPSSPPPSSAASRPPHLTFAADEGIGHSFCYVRPHHDSSSSEDASAEYTSISSSNSSNSSACSPVTSPHLQIGDAAAVKTTFGTISGASVCANAASMPCCFYDQLQQGRINASFNRHVAEALAATGGGEAKAAAFECTECFTSLPLQPVPAAGARSVPVIGNATQLQRGFLSGPLERISYSGPFEYIDAAASYSAPLPNYVRVANSHKVSGILRTVLGRVQVPKPRVMPSPPPQQRQWWKKKVEDSPLLRPSPPSSRLEAAPRDLQEGHPPLQWAQCKAGEDRVHVVLSEEHGWLFVGIYDGFNGPDAPDFLVSNLYANIYKELQGLLWGSRSSSSASNQDVPAPLELTQSSGGVVASAPADSGVTEDITAGGRSSYCRRSVLRPKRGMSFPASRHSKAANDGLQKKTQSLSSTRDQQGGGGGGDDGVLQALARALETTEAAFMEMGEKAIADNKPEIALMGSCVLVMLMTGEDVYVMNVGDSRAIVAQRRPPRQHRRRHSEVLGSIPAAATDLDLHQLESIVEESDEHMQHHMACHCGCGGAHVPELEAVQLSLDHSTSAEEEVERIKAEHPDDEQAIVNGRVKGTLKVTRAFGAGFLKKASWNEAVLEMLRVEYVGAVPYVSSRPWLQHHKVQRDRDEFLVLSSDGLYQYLTNHEVVSHVRTFLHNFPDGDPAQHLLELLLFRAASKAGMKFHELLDIPQGDRRKYHDDVSVMVISLQGRIWKCSS